MKLPLVFFCFILFTSFSQTAAEHDSNGLALYKENFFVLAIEEFTKALELDSTYANAYLNRGSSNFSIAEYALAASDYAKAIEYGTKVNFVYEYKAKANLYIGQYSLALSDYTQAIRIDNKRDDFYADRANCYHHLEQYVLAINDYDSALILSPTNTVTLKKRAFSKTKAQRYKEAEEDYNRLIELDNVASHYYDRGYVRYCQKKYSQAIKDFNIVLKEIDLFYDAYKYRAASYFALHQYPKAIFDYSKLISMKNSEFYFERGRCKYLLKDYAGAVADYDARIKLAPNNQLAHYHRGLAKLKLKDKKGCCEDWTIAARFGNEQAKKKLKRKCN